jgi:5'(3')-deoxyribonucleotidase
MREKKILYVDMDGVIANFEAAIHRINPNIVFGVDAPDKDEVDQIVMNNPRMFTSLPAIEGGIEAVKRLAEHYEIYFLSSPMWEVPQSFMDKRLWIMGRFGAWTKKRLILTHQKDLNIGDYLVDDRTANGAGNFTGKHLLFGSEEFPNWVVVEQYLMNELNK